MTTVTERRIVTDTAQTDIKTMVAALPASVAVAAAAVGASTAGGPPPVPAKSSSLRKAMSSGSSTDAETGYASESGGSTYLNSTASSETSSMNNSISSQINGILKGGKLWKNEQVQVRILF